MAGYWRLMGRYDAETTTYSACAGTGATSPYTPDVGGTLRMLRTEVGGGAATSLANHIQFKLTCATFRPNSIECYAQGAGLQTAPYLQPKERDFVVNQPVQAGVPITIEGRNLNAETPVTVDAMIYGYFE